jgi:hypothetical protein
MKIFSAVTAVALLLGAGAIMHAPAAHAEADPNTCAGWEAGCQAQIVADCYKVKDYCGGRTSTRPTVAAAPPAKSNETK